MRLYDVHLTGVRLSGVRLPTTAPFMVYRELSSKRMLDRIICPARNNRIMRAFGRENKPCFLSKG